MGFREDAMTAISPRASVSRKWVSIHRFNAIFLAAFILLHFATHLSGLWGIEAYNSVQSEFRKIYREPIVEWAVLISITLQILLGGTLLIDRIKVKGITGFWGWLQVVSGVVFLVFMAQHLYSLGMARLYFTLDTNFYWPASVMSGPWFIYYFAPYYFLGVFALFAHIGAGARFVLADRGYQRSARILGVGFVISGAVIGMIIPPIIAGAFFPIELPGEWIEYLRFYDPEFEPW